MALHEKPPQSERLSPRLEAVLARLCRRLGPMSTTSVPMLPYLVDVVATHSLGAPITEGTHETWEHGVVTREVWSYLRRGGAFDAPFVIEDHGAASVIRLVEEEPDGGLSPEELAIVDQVAADYGRLDASALGRLTQALNTHLEARAWGQCRRAAVDEDAYARLSDSYQAFAHRLPSLDLADERDWSEPIENSRDYLRRALGG